MTLNPLVEKILESTVQKGLDMGILNELEYTPDEGCELAHKDGKTVCSGKATHWQDANLHRETPKKICENAYKWNQARIDGPDSSYCGDCFEQHGTKNKIWQCWHMEPIQK